MATEHTNVFLPLIDESRMGHYGPEDFQLTSRLSDSGVDIQFTHIENEDQDQNLFMIAPGEVFFVAAGTTVAFENGPEITAPPAPAEKNVAVIHVISTYNWAPILATTGQPLAEWWALEGITKSSFEAFVDGHDLEELASLRGQTGAEYREAILTGDASLNIFRNRLPITFGNFAAGEDGSSTLGLRAWASYGTESTELDALSALATIKYLAPALDDHPVLTSAITTVSTSDVTIHVRFVYWKPGESNATTETDKGSFEPVPLKSKISLQRRHPKNPKPEYFTIVEETVTDNSGQVALIVPRAELNAVDLNLGDRLVFRVDVPPGTQFDIQYHHNRPAYAERDKARLKWGVGEDYDFWIADGRKTTDDAIENLDFLVDYENNIVGTAAQPIEYYAGLPVFLQIQYPVLFTSGNVATANFESLIRKAPKGLKVEIRSAVDATLIGFFSTDEHGQIWGMLTFWNEDLKLPFEVIVKYEMEDKSIKLPTIHGEVVEGGNTFESYSSNKDYRNADEISNQFNASLGKTTGAGGKAIALANVHVGFVHIPEWELISEFSSTDGRHAGVIHALQQLRYVHQWFHYLTQNFTFGTEPDGITPKDESWAKILENHNNKERGTSNNGGHYHYVHLPKIRVTTPKATDEGITGEVAYDTNETPDLRWWLILYGFDEFEMNQKINVPDGAGGLKQAEVEKIDNRVQFWRVHTIWHEFTHAVMNMALERLFNLDTSGTMTAAKDALTSGRLDQVIFDSFDGTGIRLSGGWSTFEEGLAAVPEVALWERATGKKPHIHPAPQASPRHLFVDIDAAGVVNGNVNPATDLNLSQGTSIDLNLDTGPPVFNDQRIGLRVPIAFTWGLWSVLQELGGFNETLQGHVTGTTTLNDLTDAVAYMNTLTNLAQAQKIFQAMFWGPLVAMRPDRLPAAPPPQWNDLTVPANGPTTFSMMETIQTNFWAGLSAGEKTKIKELFEDTNNPLSYYLWFSFP